VQIAELNFLAVEDHEFQRRVLLRILAGLGAVRIQAASHGGEALTLAKSTQGRPDIIISDLDMPGVDGLEFMRLLGEARIPAAIILVSALGGLLLGSARTLTEEYGLNLLGVIEKPVTPAKLQTLIDAHLAAQPGSHIAAPVRLGPGFTATLILQRIGKGLKQKLVQCVGIARPGQSIDTTVLASVCGADAALAREILADFQRVNAGDAAMLEVALDKRDAVEVTAACERIRTASRTIGARALAAACDRLERSSTAGDWQTVKGRREAFQREVARVHRHCREA
jgi:CheY-like chemotaxis protein/HPt (histidine-containing phosphotransfer) domain-containing protein